MSCEICGRSSCTRSFHSLESQNEFDNIADAVKDRMRTHLLRAVGWIKDSIEVEGKEYVLLSDVESIIDGY
jgi:hypothetical protein